MSTAALTTLMRDVNSRIYETLAGMGTEDAEFLCECGDPTCLERVQMTLREYEAIKRRISPGAVVAPAHEHLPADA